MKRFRTLSLSSQIFFLISSFILLLILIQFIIYRLIFQGFYFDSRIANIESDINDYVDNLSNIEDNNYFQTMYDFTSKNNMISLVLDHDFSLVDSEFSYFSIEVTNSTTYDVYDIKLPEAINTIKESDRVSALIKEDPNSNDYEVFKLNINNEEIYNAECTECTEVKGYITEVRSPINQNIYFKNSQIAMSEIYKIRSLKDFSSGEYTGNGFRFINETEFSRNVVYLHKINDDHYVMTIQIMESTEEIKNILGTYNLTIYAVMVALAIIISTIVSRLISRPIKSIDNVAREISNLNFDIEATEYQNKETSSLTENINTIAVNLKENIDQLNHRNNEALYLYEKQKGQVKVRKRFISAISHELKTPLMVMNITIQGILDGIFSSDDQDEELQKVLAEITNIDSMIKDLLDVFKIDEISIKEDLDKINLKTITQNTLNSVENLTKQYKQIVTFDTVRSPIIYGDAKLISMVISNIITNAIKYTPIEDKIDISIQSKKDTITFRATNYGVQIPEESLDHLFEPFYRVDKSRTKTTKTKGTGLGLYIVSETLKAHGFSYGIKNIDNGVTVWFTALKNNKNFKTR